MKGGVKKRGDHLFNHGLTKLDLMSPDYLFLKEAFHQFQRDLKRIEEEGGFKLVAVKVDRVKDENADLFGERIATLRIAWAELTRVVDARSHNPQHRASAAFWVIDALEKLHQASFDAEAEKALIQESNPVIAREVASKTRKTAHAIEEAFHQFIQKIVRLLPPPGAISWRQDAYRTR